MAAPPHPRWRVGWKRPLMLLVLVLGLSEQLRAQPGTLFSGVGAVSLVAAAVVALCSITLLVDRWTPRLPMPAFVAIYALLVAATATLVLARQAETGFIGGIVAASIAASRWSVRTGLLVTAGTIALLGGLSLAGHRSLSTTGLNCLAMIAFFSGGVAARRLHDRTRQAEELLAELQRTRAAVARSAAIAERQRLAREMHDVLAHSLSGLVLHLEGARLLARHDGENPRLADAVERAHHLAQAGLAEARQAVGMLRGDDLPGLETLARNFDGDVAVEFTETGEPSELDSSTRLTLYRVAQEALTNIRKHATPSRVQMALAHEPGGVRLTVEDFGAPAPADPGTGYGLTGMRERAELLGATLDAGPTGTGFRVELWVPA